MDDGTMVVVENAETYRADDRSDRDQCLTNRYRRMIFTEIKNGQKTVTGCWLKLLPSYWVGFSRGILLCSSAAGTKKRVTSNEQRATIFQSPRSCGTIKPFDP
jgi:hypothetical protein